MLLKVLCPILLFLSPIKHDPSITPLTTNPPLQLTFVMLQSGPVLPRFEFRIRNISDHDLVLNLGTLLGTKQYLDAVIFSVLDASGKTLQLMHMGSPAGVAGRVDPLIVSLPMASSFSFPVDLELYCAPVQAGCPLRLSPGPYVVRADYYAANAQGLDPFQVWRGHVRSSAASFVVTRN